jgi:hypothetical protein
MEPKPIPLTQQSLVLRTDFSDDAKWKSLCRAIQKPVGEFRAAVEFVDDRQYDGLTIDQVLQLVPKEFNHSEIYLVDQMSISHRDRPILAVDLYENRGRTCRVVPTEMWAIENNLSISNMGFSDFADAVDADEIFRRFPE